MFSNVLSLLSSSNNQMLDIMTREICGNNIPHVAIVRNKDEFIDQSISQFGNTAAYFGTGFTLDKLIARIPKALKQPDAASNRWFILGKSLSIFSFIAALNMAMPFLRNYITTKRTRSNNYAEIVGEKTKKATSEKDLQATLDKHKKRFLKTVSIGAAISAASLASGLLLMKGKRPLPKAVAFFDKHFSLTDGKFSKFNPKSAVAFWVIPTFAGLLSGARDKYEVKELGLRFAAFNLAFFVFPISIEKMINHLVKDMKPTKLFGPASNLAYLGKFISSLIFCSAVPTVLNIHLTRQRVKRDEQQKRLQMLQ